MGGFIWTGIIGLVVGFAAKLLLHGRNGPQGLLATAILGVIGSYLASFLGQLLGFYDSGQYAGFFGSVIGAVILLVLWDRLFRKPKALT